MTALDIFALVILLVLAAAILVAFALLGYLPVGFGYSPVLLVPTGLLVLFLLVRLLGRPAEKSAQQHQSATDALN